jgi:putative glutamine amidotransferase
VQFTKVSAFALGVQWHAEYDPQKNPVNRMLFQAFCAAVARTSNRGQPPTR